MSNNDIIFLDCDGVINNDEFISEWIALHGDSDDGMLEFKSKYYIHDGESGYVVPLLANRLRRICSDTDCRIVWSSSWRENYWIPDIDTGEFRFDFHAIAKLWRAKGFPLERLIGCTPCLDSSRFSYVPRGLEIQSWIDDNGKRYNIRKVAVLDDNEDAFVGVRHSQARFFHTDFESGLTQEIADEMTRWFREQS